MKSLVVLVAAILFSAASAVCSGTNGMNDTRCTVRVVSFGPNVVLEFNHRLNGWVDP